MPILSAPIRPRCIEPPRLCARPNVAGRTENPGGAGLYAAMIATPSSNTTGILLAIGGSVVMSLNDLAIKALSGDYALHQVILLRALIGMALVLAVTVYSPAGMRQLITGRRGAHLLRVSIVMVSNITYFVGLSLMPLGDGNMAQAPGSTFEFLFRPWHWPPLQDAWAFAATGLAVGIGGLMMSQAYRTTEAALVAPFEYVGMPMAVIWGVIFFGTFPDTQAWVGIALICGAGLYTLWRETVRKKDVDVAAPSGDL